MMLSCPTTIYLQPIPDPIGYGREWYRLEYVYCGPTQLGLHLPPVFHVEPKGTYFEQWRDTANGGVEPGAGDLMWFTGESGTYKITAELPCGANTKISVDLR